VRIDSKSIGVVRRRRAQQLGGLAVALYVLAFLAAPLTPERVFSAIWLLRVAAIVLSVRAMRATKKVEYAQGSIELEEQAIRVVAGGERVIPLQRVDGALVRDLRWLELRLRDGDVISVELDASPAGHAFVRELEKRGAVRLAIRAMHPELSWRPLVAPAGLAITVATSLVLGAAAFASVANPLTRLLALAAVVITTFVAIHATASAGLTLGADGITIARAFSARFVPWSAVERTELVEGALYLRLRDKSLVLLSADRKTPMRTATLIDRALSRARGASPDATTAALERDGRDVAQWRAELVGLTDEHSEAEYRGIHLPRATLEDVLDDPAAPAERRIGAALALRAIDPSYATRVRLAAGASANEHLRIALEKVADDDVDLATVEDASRAEQG